MATPKPKPLPGPSDYEHAVNTWFSGLPLEKRTKFWVLLQEYSGGRLYNLWKTEVFDKLGVPLNKETYPTFKVGFEAFLPKAADRLITDLTANPEVGVKIWSEVLADNYSRIESEPALKDFADRMENATFRAYAGRELAESKGSEAAVTANQEFLRQMIHDDAQDYASAAVAGVNSWHLPYIPPSKMTDVLSGSSGVTAAAGSVVAIWALEGAVVMTGGIALLAIGAGLAVGAAISSYNEKDEAARHQELQGRIQEGIIDGFNGTADLVNKNQDLAALMLIGEARKEGIKLDKAHRTPLEPWVWKKLFGTFPYGHKAGTEAVKEAMHERLDPKLRGE